MTSCFLLCCGVPDHLLVPNACLVMGILDTGQILASLLDGADVQHCTHRKYSIPLQDLSRATPVMLCTVIASYEGIPISVLELALHILLQHAFY